MKDLIDRLPKDAFDTIGQGLRLRKKELKRIRSTLVTAGLDHAAEDIDGELDLLLGKGEDPGLLVLFEVDDDTLERKRAEEEAAADNLEQRDLEDARDYRTHGMNTEAVRELLSAIAADNPPARAVQVMNALEDGENEREGGARESVLKVIRAARSPLVKRVKALAGNGASAPVEG